MGQDNKTATSIKAADEQRGSADGRAADSRTKTRAAKVQGKDRDMGTALRSVYQRTVDEAIPDDLLDLLGKLG
ncbi:NepR family anti-sigma factor [Sphingomonas sp.]|uniref:NepR family anti-sigma factor n=1 Tax=Sphingomonas sp. TaxID=28214 RepID=UPI002ED9305C